MKTAQLIIDRPQLVSRSRRFLYGMATLFFWYLWFYLWLPVVTFIAWLVSGFLGYREMVQLSNYRDLLHAFSWYALVILILGGGLLAWATYNLLRFRGKERRRPLPDVSLETYAQYIGVAQSDLAAWRSAKIVIVHNDRSGRIESVDVRLPSTQRAP
jgi:biofilm PGA synthesis protein PgaD